MRKVLERLKGLGGYLTPLRKVPSALRGLGKIQIPSKAIIGTLCVGLIVVIHFFVSVPLADALRSLFASGAKTSVTAPEGLGGGTTTPSFSPENWGYAFILVGVLTLLVWVYFHRTSLWDKIRKKKDKAEGKPKKKDDSYHWYPFWAYWFYWPGLIGSYVWLVGWVMPQVLSLLPFNLNPVLSGIGLALPFIGHARTLTDGNRKGPRPVVLGIGHVFSVLGVVVYVSIIFMTVTGQLLWCRDVWGTGTCRFVGGLFEAIWTNVQL